MHATGGYTIADLTEVFSVGRATVYRVLNRARNCAAAQGTRVRAERIRCGYPPRGLDCLRW